MFLIVRDCLPLLIIFSALHLTIIPYLCSDLAFSVYFTGNGTTDSTPLAGLVSPEEEERVESRMRIVILTSEREGGVSYRLSTILSVEREISRARETYHQIFVCSADRGDLADIPHTNLSLLQPCKHQRTEMTDQAPQSQHNLTLRYFLPHFNISDHRAHFCQMSDLCRGKERKEGGGGLHHLS